MLAALHQLDEILFRQVGEQLGRVVPAKTGHDIDIPAVLLVDQRVDAVHEHIEARPVIALALHHTPVKIQQLPPHTDTQAAQGGPHGAAVALLFEEGNGDRVDHAHDIMVGTVQPRQALGGQVVGNRTVHPLARRQIRLGLTVHILRHQHHRRKHPRHGAGCHHGSPYIDVGRCDGVEQARALVRLRRRHRDTDLPAGLLIGLLEGQVRYHPRDQPPQVPDVYLRIGAEEHTGEHARFLLRLEQDIGGAVKVLQLPVGMGAQHARHQRAGTGARNHPRQQALLQQGLDHAQMIKTQHAPAAEHQRRAAVANVGAVEKIELLLRVDQRVVDLRQVAQGFIYLVNILFYQLLGAKPGLAIQAAAPHPAHIAVDALVEREQQAVVVVPRPQAANAVEPQADLGVIVLAGLVDLTPASLTRQLIVFQRRRAPLVVADGFGHCSLKLFELA